MPFAWLQSHTPTSPVPQSFTSTTPARQESAFENNEQSSLSNANNRVARLLFPAASKGEDYSRDPFSATYPTSPCSLDGVPRACTSQNAGSFQEKRTNGPSAETHQHHQTKTNTTLPASCPILQSPTFSTAHAPYNHRVFASTYRPNYDQDPQQYRSETYRSRRTIPTCHDRHHQRSNHDIPYHPPHRRLLQRRHSPPSRRPTYPRDKHPRCEDCEFDHHPTSDICPTIAGIQLRRTIAVWAPENADVVNEGFALAVEGVSQKGWAEFLEKKGVELRCDGVGERR